MFYGTLPEDTQDFRQVLAGIGRTIRDRAAAAGQRIGQSGQEAIALQNQAFADPRRPTRVTDEAALARLTDMIMGGPMGFAPAGITKLKNTPINEILFPNKAISELTSAEKSAITRFEKALDVPAVRKRETIALEGKDIVTPTEGVRLVEEIGIHPQSLLGKRVVPVMGDQSATGGTVTQIAGIPLERPVLQQGGRRYSTIQQNVGENIAWASEPSAAGTKIGNLNFYAQQGEPTLGVYMAMGPQGINFSHHIAEGMIGQLQTLKPSKSAIKELNEEIRNLKVRNPESGEVTNPYKKFAGIDSPSIYEIMSRGTDDFSAGGIRKAIVETMSKAKYRDLGFPKWEDTARVMSEPGLAMGETGRTIFEAIPGAQVATPSFVHGSYSAGIPGRYVGGLLDASGNIRGVPDELMLPQTFARMRAMGKADPQIRRSMMMSYHGEKLDEKAIENLMRYLGYK